MNSGDNVGEQVIDDNGREHIMPPVISPTFASTPKLPYPLMSFL
jgi:hypothetical protein